MNMQFLGLMVYNGGLNAMDMNHMIDIIPKWIIIYIKKLFLPSHFRINVRFSQTDVILIKNLVHQKYQKLLSWNIYLAFFYSKS